MEICCSSWSLNREIPQRLPLLQFPAWCGSQAITAIEIVDSQLPSMEQAYLQELREACAHARVHLACLAISNDFTLPDADQLFAQVERTRHLLYDVAIPLQIPVLRVLLGTADPSTAGDQRALETFRGMVTDLEATGVAMALEHHPRVDTTPEQTFAIIVGVGTPLFGSCLDFGCEVSDRSFHANNILAPCAKHVHARSSRFDVFGEEVEIDYKREIAILNEHGYDGIISIDYEGRENPYQGILATRQLIGKYWYNPAAEPGRKAA